MTSIPLSDALSEADPNSLQRLFSLDPEKYTTQDLEAVIAEMRTHRDRLDAAAAAGTKPRQPKLLPAPAIAPINPEDLGL